MANSSLLSADQNQTGTGRKSEPLLQIRTFQLGFFFGFGDFLLGFVFGSFWAFCLFVFVFVVVYLLGFLFVLI